MAARSGYVNCLLVKTAEYGVLKTHRHYMKNNCSRQGLVFGAQCLVNELRDHCFLKKQSLRTKKYFLFQRDGAKSRTANTTAFLQHFRNRNVQRGHSPARSLDFAPSGLFLQGYLEESIYSSEQDIRHLTKKLIEKLQECFYEGGGMLAALAEFTPDSSHARYL